MVFEIQFQQIATYPPDDRLKQWAPPMSELEKTLATGKVTQVFKGNISPGDTRQAAWEIPFNPGGSTVADWDRFLSLSSFSQIVFLKKEGERFVSTGWAEESAPCGSSPHRSWCASYAEFRERVQACLEAKPRSSKPQR